MNYWLKRFGDHTEIRGTDQDTSRGLVSWSRSRLDNMVGVELHHNKVDLSIYGEGEYWQSDTFESNMSNGQTTLIARRIERKIKITDQFFSWVAFPYAHRIYFNQLNYGKMINILPQWFDKWLILQYDISNTRIGYRIGERI